LDLIVTMDDATGEIYFVFLTPGKDTASTFQASLEVFDRHGLPQSLYTNRDSHYFFTPDAGGPVDRTRLTQVGRAVAPLDVAHIPAYQPEARGRSERMFQTSQDRLARSRPWPGSPRSERPTGLSAAFTSPMDKLIGYRRPGSARRRLKHRECDEINNLE
jgi:hypothetical protein